MADIVSIHDDKPENIPEGQTAYLVDGVWALTTCGEPSSLEVHIWKLLAILESKGIVQSREVSKTPIEAEIMIDGIEPTKSDEVIKG